MRKIKYGIMLFAASLMTACVEDKMYEGPSNIESIKTSVDAPTSDDEVTVTAVIGGLQTVKSAKVDYTTSAGAKQSVDMREVKASTYEAVIPAQEDKTEVSFTVTVVNAAGYTTVSDVKTYKVGDLPVDYTKLVLNELYGAAADDAGKFIELYNNGDVDIKLKGVTLQKDEALAWTGIEGEIVPAHGCFAIVGAKKSTERGISSGFSSKKTVLIQLFDPNNNQIDKFQRGEKGTGWGDGALTNVKGSWSRVPDGTGRWMITDPTVGEKNKDAGTEDETVMQ